MDYQKKINSASTYAGTDDYIAPEIKIIINNI